MSSLVFEKLAQSLAANQTWPLQIAGDFFRVEACEWPVTVEIMSGGRVVGRMTNVRAGDFVRDIAFDQVRIINGATAQAVTVQIAGGGVGSDRVIGEVSVIDGGKARTIAGGAFFGSSGVNASAGTYAHVQLENPAGSGKRVVLEQVIFSTATAGLLSLRSGYASLANSSGGAPSKLLGGAASAGVRRWENIAGVSGSPMTHFIIGANAPLVVKFAEPVVISENQRLTAAAGTLNTDLFAAWEFFEETT